VEWLSEIFHDGSGPGQGAAERVLRLVGLGTRAGADGDTRLALALLLAAALRCWWGDSDDAVRNEVVEAISSLPGPPAEPQRVAAIATAHPIEHGPEVADLLREAGTVDARGAYLLGMAGHAVGDYEASQRQFALAAERLREQGRLALLAQAQVMRSVECVLLGDFALADAAATEAAALAAETRQPIWLAGATGSLAAIAGVRGDLVAARELSAQAHATLESTGTTAVLGWLCVTYGLIELSAGRHEEAYASLRRIFDPLDPAHLVLDQFMGVAYLADAAAGRGETGEARRIVAALARLAARSPLPGLRGGLDYARPLLAHDEDADDEFRAALAAPWSSRRFERERLNLAYGVWLRRRRRVLESREPLRVALTGFEALGLPIWAERARGELRAAGESTVTRSHEAWRDLSPQELEIARLAAAGMSNREIGRRLYLSHRTVASHLYRIFPKLGITSRTQLNAALPPS
jgi:DNA-binding CsgD family transcriptional regulator